MRIENRATFFTRIAGLWPVGSAEYQLIERAYNAAKEAFRPVMRDGGERYFEHLRQVAIILMDVGGVTDAEDIAAALLHDTVEDLADWTIDRVYAEFGFGVAMRVLWVTKPPVKDPNYPRRFATAPANIKRLKLADNTHNMRTVHGCVPGKRAHQVSISRRYYVPLAAESEPALYAALTEAIDQAER